MKNRIISIVIALIVSQVVVLVLHLFAINPLFIILGFRVYIPFVIAGLVALIIEKPDVLQALRHTGSKRIFFSALFFLILGAALYFLEPSGVWQKNDPENLFELGLSSVFDAPLYAFWNLPQFLLLYLFLGTSKKKLQIPVNILLLIALCAVDLFYQLQNVKVFPLWVLCFAVAVLVLSIYWYRSGNGIEFAIFSYLFVWLGTLLFGVKELLIIKMIFAKNFVSWEGLLQSKTIAPELLLCGVFAASLLPVIFFRRKIAES